MAATRNRTPEPNTPLKIPHRVHQIAQGQDSLRCLELRFCPRYLLTASFRRRHSSPQRPIGKALPPLRVAAPDLQKPSCGTLHPQQILSSRGPQDTGVKLETYIQFIKNLHRMKSTYEQHFLKKDPPPWIAHQYVSDFQKLMQVFLINL